MPWIGSFNRSVSEAYNGVDGYFSAQSLQIGGVLEPYEAVTVTPTRVTLISHDFLGLISFVGTGLSVVNVTTSGSLLPFPKLDSGTITRIETRYNGEVSDAIDRLAVATTQAERDAALADAHQFGTQANLLLPKNDNAVIQVPNVSAKALGDAVVTSMQAHSEGPIQAFLSQFQHFYTAPRPGADVVGFNNDDLLVGGPGFNRLVGQGGNDTIDGGTGGPNIMQGGDGSDLYLMTAGQDLISDGILDNDVDIASYIRAPQGLVIDMEPLDGDQSTGFAAGDTLGGVEGVIGSNFDDVILGRSVLQGGSSSDVIDGAGGNDSLSGGGGSDTLRGGAGFDLIDGGSNEDNVGNPGPPDIAVWDAAPNAVHFFFNGSDIIVATAFEGVDTVRNVEALSFAGQLFGLNQLTPSQANLQIDSGGAQALTGGPGVDLLYGLDGNDRLEGAGAGDWLIGDAGNDTIIGGDGNDMGSGGGGNDSILGDGGNDQLVGGVGKDTIKGGAGNDRLSGNGGPDLIIANGGNDRVNGGSGNDVAQGRRRQRRPQRQWRCRHHQGRRRQRQRRWRRRWRQPQWQCGR